MTAALRKDPTMKVLLALLFLLVFQYPAFAETSVLRLGITKQEASKLGYGHSDRSYRINWNNHLAFLKMQFTDNKLSRIEMLVLGSKYSEAVEFYSKLYGPSTTNYWNAGRTRIMLKTAGPDDWYTIVVYYPEIEGSQDL